MTAKEKMFDVFISYSACESDAAVLAERSLLEAGLSVFDARKEIGPGEDFSKAIRQALAESAAVVFVSGGEQISASVTVELGAAMAWSKPVYVVDAGTPSAPLPTYLQEYQVYPTSRLDDLARAILQSLRPLTKGQIDILLSVYVRLNTPTDKLLSDPLAVERLVKEFNQECGLNVSGESLVRELLHLRKGGRFPRLRRMSGKRRSER